jgi:predicted nucleic acid-binding protein
MSAADSFFDSNILLYLLSSDTRKADRVEELLASGGVITVQVLNEIASVALRKLRLDMADIRDLLGVVRGVCDVRPVDLETHERALDLVERYRFSLHDGLIVAGALLAGCTTLHTEDLQDGQRIETLTIANPFV